MVWKARGKYVFSKTYARNWKVVTYWSVGKISWTRVNLHHVRNLLLSRETCALKTIALLRQTSRREVDMKRLDGFEIPDDLFVGFMAYGLRNKRDRNQSV